MSATATQTSISTPLSGAQDSSYVPRGPVSTKLNFFREPEDGSKPYNFVETQPEGQPQRNFGVAEVDIQVNDIRGRENEFWLDKDAFQAIKGVSSEETEFVDDEHVKNVYYPEVEKLLLENVPGAHKVTLFDHTIRRSNPDAPRAPVTRVHVDQTARSTEWRVRLHNPEDADELLKGRYRIINVWRPINGTVQAHPLGFASADTVDDNDLIPVEHRYPHRTGETAAVRHNQNQTFYYWSGMDNDERLFLKCYDSKDGVGQRVPHTAFIDPRTPEGAKGRESIEASSSSLPSVSERCPNSTSTTDFNDDLNLYFYNPSTPLAIVFSVLYFLLTLYHGYINFISTRHVFQKHKYTIPLFVACSISTAGWSVRIASIHNLSSIPLYAVSASYIVISPIFVCATLYLLLTRLIHTTLLEENKQQIFFGVPPRWLGRVFITSDVFSFLTQCSGSGIASSGNWKGNLKTVGMNVLLCGLSLQLATFSTFLLVLWRFVRRVARAKDIRLDPCVKKVVWGVWVASAFVQVRSIYRVVEFAMGVDGYPFKHEWCLYVFEGTPMLIALTVLALYHPVKRMQQKSRAEFSMQEGAADAKRPIRIHGFRKENAA